MTATTSGLASAVSPGIRTKRVQAVFSAWAGFAMDSYSIYISSSTLLPALIYFQGTNMTVEGKAIFAGGTLAATLLGRPIGGLIFGHFADRLGRKRIGSITIMGFGVISLLIACLPGAQQVGAALSVSLLIGLRFIDGIFLGGEYTAATPLALEYSSNKRRGMIGALIQCGANGGPFFVALFMSLVLLVLPNTGGLDAPYVQWGWRVPFVLGFILAVLVSVFLRRKVEDSDTWQTAVGKVEDSKRVSPLREMLRGRSGRAFIQAWVMMTGIFFIVNLTGSVLQQFLITNPGFTASDLAHTSLVTPVPGMIAYVFFGWLSDRLGRKRTLFITAPMTLVFYPIIITLIGAGNIKSWGLLTLMSVAINILTVSSLGVLPAYINERFSTAVRSSGWGVAYGTAVIIPSFFSYYMVWLGHLIPFTYTAGVLAGIGAIIVIIATAFGPETAGIDLKVAGTADGTRASRALNLEPPVTSGS